MRAAIVILPIKLSVDSGVWSTNTEEGASLYSRLKSDVIPGTIVYFDEMPSFSDTKLLLTKKWNGAVNFTFASANRAAQMLEKKA
uniref:MICOS complex subunit MIC13 n=1 Tax=Meloidogyne hapla TaxID=6305 RepID=A0A1I8BQN9_MELHA